MSYYVALIDRVKNGMIPSDINHMHGTTRYPNQTLRHLDSPKEYQEEIIYEVRPSQRDIYQLTEMPFVKEKFPHGWS